jgi:hypothetical protein
MQTYTQLKLLITYFYSFSFCKGKICFYIIYDLSNIYSKKFYSCFLFAQAKKNIFPHSVSMCTSNLIYELGLSFCNSAKYIPWKIFFTGKSFYCRFPPLGTCSNNFLFTPLDSSFIFHIISIRILIRLLCRNWFSSHEVNILVTVLCSNN